MIQYFSAGKSELLCWISLAPFSEQWGLLIMSDLAEVEDCQCRLRPALGQQRGACYAMCCVFARLDLQKS